MLEHFEVDARSEQDVAIAEILDNAQDALAANELEHKPERDRVSGATPGIYPRSGSRAVF
jgi:hypothetical protein